MLIPRGMAKEATDGNVRSLEKAKAVQAQKDTDAKAAAEKLAEELKDKEIVIRTKGGEGGKLFGSITTKDIEAAVKDQLGVKIDKKKMQMESPIKHIGSHEVAVKLAGGVAAVIRVKVEAE